MGYYNAKGQWVSSLNDVNIEKPKTTEEQLADYVNKNKTVGSGNGSAGASANTGYAPSIQSQLNSVQASANNTAQNGIVSQDVWDRINQKFEMSANTIAAMNKTNELLQKVTDGRTSFTDKMNQMMAQIEGRDKFSYDPNSDTLFQNALSGAMGKGQTTMRDTMGQAAGLTGGYGSSYSQAVGNQAYNKMIEDAYDNLPQYYQMALNQYNQEGQDLYNLLGMYQNADSNEYNRLVNAYEANRGNWQDLYNQEFNMWNANVSNAMSQAGLQMNESNSIFDRQMSALNATQNYDSEMWDRIYKNASMAQSQANADRNFYYNYLTDMMGQEQKLAAANDKEAEANKSNAKKKHFDDAIKVWNETEGTPQEKYDAVYEHLMRYSEDELNDAAIAELIDYFINNIKNASAQLKMQ